MPRPMGPEGMPVRGGKSPRSLAVKLTGLTAHNLPSKKPAAKKPAAKKRWCKAVQMGRDDGEGTHEPEERRPADTWRQARI
jgi:hypothetical protein